MYTYGNIIEYLDDSYDENFNNARRWANDHQASLDEIIEKRKVKKDHLYRYFQINKYPESKPQLKQTKEELTRQKRLERDTLLQSTDKYMLPDFPITEEKRKQYAEYRNYLRNIPESTTFPDIKILSFDEWINR